MPVFEVKCATKSLTEKDIERTNAIMDEDNSTDSNKNKAVDRIVTEKLDGDDPVSDAEKKALEDAQDEQNLENAEVNSEKSEEEVTPTSEDAAPVEESKSEDESAEASVVKVFKEYLDVLKAHVEANNKVLEELTQVLKAQAEMIEKAVVVVDETPAPKVEDVSKAARPDISAKGGLFAHLEAAFKQNDKSDQ